MTLFVTYYPEFTDTEVEQVIAPLHHYDDEVTAVLAGATDSAQAMQKWADDEEVYPFQRIVRAVSAGVAGGSGGELIDSFADMLADPRAVLAQLLTRVEARMSAVYTRPIVAAVNHARERGVLHGTTPRERYRSFVEQSLRTSFETVSGLSFPVLQEITRVVLRNEVDAFRELCTRLRDDRLAIRDRFGIDHRDPLVSFGLGEGDTHNHGRSVSVLVFGSGRRLVYKPRDVSCEAAYVVLADEFNRRWGTNLVSAAVLQRERYGYVEFIQAEDVSDMSAQFMSASGELAAVLYLLNARDMHYENILPTRRGPVPIDLETILHPRRIYTGSVPEAPGNAHLAISESVYGIGILPLVMAGPDADGGHLDLGFLGNQGRGTSPFRSIQFREPFTDEISLAFGSVAAAERHTVVSAVTEHEVQDLGAQMADSFARTYRRVASDPDGWADLLRRTAEHLRVRYIHNPTSLYSQTLRMTSGPGALDSTGTYLALLKRIGIASKTSDRRIIRSEMRQLAERDVPFFTVAATDTALTDGEGTEVGVWFVESPLDVALAKVSRLSDFDLGEQLRLIHSAFASRFPDNHLIPSGTRTGSPESTVPNDRLPAPSGHSSGDALTELVRQLCDHLSDTARPDLFAHLPLTWIGPLASASADRPWPPGVLGYELYTGRTGPALALAAAARVLDDGRYRDLAGQVFSTTADILVTQTYETRSIQQAGYGGYTGMAGILFALSVAGRILGEDGWSQTAQRALPLVLDQIRDQDPDRVPADVISGLAGVLLCVTAIGGPHASAAVSELTERLVAALRRRDEDDPAHVFAQSGFAHGISGIMYALCRAHPQLPVGRRPAVETELIHLADRLHRFYDPAEENWFSNVAAPPMFSTGWCHGATGIALALDAYHTVSGESAVVQLRDRAISNIVRHGFGRNLTWCHGDLGNHDVLGALAHGDTELRTEISEIERRWLKPEVILRKIHDTRSRYAHTNSLMVGSAGIVVHLVNRIDTTHRLSPVALTNERS